MSRVRLLAVCAGCGLEAYDWGAYPLLLSYFGPAFFGEDVQRSLIYGFAVFAAGFLTRPLGGLVLGRYADSRGRKPAMRLCLAGAGVAALGMALTPTTAAIGPAAPLLVLGWRALLGFSYGGEAPLGNSYIYETTPPERRGATGSLLCAAIGIGSVGARLLVLALIAAVGSDRVADGYWRVPFLVGAAASFVFAALRGGLAESAEFEGRRREPAPSWAQARRRLRTPMLAVAGVTIGSTSASYLWSALPPAYGISVLGLNDTAVLCAVTASTLLGNAVLPMVGRLGDRLGCRRVMGAATVAMAVMMIPLRAALEHGGVTGFWVVVPVAGMINAAAVALLPAVLAGLVPGRYRVTAQALPYTVTVTVFGGTVPMLDRLTAAHPTLFGCYLVLLLTITAATLRWAEGHPDLPAEVALAVDDSRSVEPEQPRRQITRDHAPHRQYHDAVPVDAGIQGLIERLGQRAGGNQPRHDAQRAG
ncbi:MFS transporter [Nocardia terpenica]|uniref:MFS transporter n=1 Tax=Nocardia terpenica TaxID=455432 RepID=A0A6G9Z559_9NOCA|nr:MFS transporter [Nocardia terpenica]